MPTPLKRHIALSPLSRDHHEGLLLKWKIEKGIRKDVDPERIRKYVDWFIDEHLLPHFKLEEDHVFSIDPENKLVQQAIMEHNELYKLFQVSEKDKTTLSKIGELLEAHIRFEERILFGDIQSKATEEQLNKIASVHTSGASCDNYIDKFWV